MESYRMKSVANSNGKKRARESHDTKNEKKKDENDSDNELLENLEFNDDSFLVEEEKKERLAEQQRRRRRERLQNLHNRHQTEEDSNNNENNTASTHKTEQQRPQPNQKQIKQEEEAVQDYSNNGEESNDGDNNDDDDGFDMFSSSVSPVSAERPKGNNNTNNNAASARSATGTINAEGGARGVEQQDWDDAEGYYKAVIGEVITFDPTMNNDVSFRVSGVIGKGVFSSVLKCSTTHNSTSIMLPPTVALKCIRHNDTMARTAYNEIRYLQRLKGSPGIVQLLLPAAQQQQQQQQGGGNNTGTTNTGTTNNSTATATSLEHRGHVVLVFPYLEYNLRDVLQKFGKGVGLSLQAVRSYYGQLLAAATQLKKHGLIHADLKPDNILVNHDFTVVQLGDFGSALDVSSSSSTATIPTPYLCSRFYRAPETILGLAPTFAVDLWSLAVTVAELFLGSVLFRGKTNNDMLYLFMQHLGPFSNRMIRQHWVQCQRLGGGGGGGGGLPRHFDTNYEFLQQTVDPVTGQAVHKLIPLLQFPSSTPLHRKLCKAKSVKDTRTMVLQFADLLQKCLVLDPTRRIALKDALQHEFFVPKTAAAAAATTTTTTSTPG